MLPNTTIMMHHPSGVARGQASDIQNEARELMRVRNYVNGVLSVATGQDQETVRSEPDSDVEGLGSPESTVTRTPFVASR